MKGILDAVTIDGVLYTPEWLKGERGEKGDRGEPGKDGFSPTIKEKTSTETEYILTITNADGSYDTPNLMGQGGGGGAGEDGATFIPAVSAEGVISWTNDKDLPNPEPVNIKGQPGTPGERGEPGTPGRDGADGAPGAAGFSPVANVSQVADGVEISITDKTGTTTAKVINGRDGTPGRDGADGKTPVKGVDYWTTEDQQSIVQDVLAALPDGNEVSY